MLQTMTTYFEVKSSVLYTFIRYILHIQNPFLIKNENNL